MGLFAPDCWQSDFGLGAVNEPLPHANRHSRSNEMLMTPPVSQPPPHLTVRRQVDSDPSHIRIPTKLHPILSQFIMGGKLMIPKITKACGIDFKRSLSSTTKNSSLNSFKLCVFDYVHISKQKPLKDNFCFAEWKKTPKASACCFWKITFFKPSAGAEIISYICINTRGGERRQEVYPLN